MLLTAPAELLVEWLTKRTTNPYGKDPVELAETHEGLATAELLLRRAAALQVVTTVPETSSPTSFSSTCSDGRGASRESLTTRTR